MITFYNYIEHILLAFPTFFFRIGLDYYCTNYFDFKANTKRKTAKRQDC